MADRLKVGDYVVVLEAEDDASAGRVGVVQLVGASINVLVEFKEGDTHLFTVDQVERVILTAFVPGDFVTLVDIDLDRDCRIVASSGDPAIVLEHYPDAHRVRIGVLRSPDDRPYEFEIDERHVSYRERWKTR